MSRASIVACGLVSTTTRVASSGARHRFEVGHEVAVGRRSVLVGHHQVVGPGDVPGRDRNAVRPLHPRPDRVGPGELVGRRGPGRGHRRHCVVVLRVVVGEEVVDEPVNLGRQDPLGQEGAERVDAAIRGDGQDLLRGSGCGLPEGGRGEQERREQEAEVPGWAAGKWACCQRYGRSPPSTGNPSKDCSHVEAVLEGLAKSSGCLTALYAAKQPLVWKQALTPVAPQRLDRPGLPAH